MGRSAAVGANSKQMRIDCSQTCNHSQPAPRRTLAAITHQLESDHFPGIRSWQRTQTETAIAIIQRSRVAEK